MTNDDNFIDYEVPSPDRPFYLEIDGQRIYVDEETYRDYKRPEWAEWKRKERDRRCRVSNGKGGLKRCTDSCSACSHFKSGSTLSIDKATEDYSLEVIDESQGILEDLIKQEFYQMLWDAVAELGELDQQIVNLYSQRLSERAIGEVVGLSQKAVNKRKNNAFEILIKKLK